MTIADPQPHFSMVNIEKKSVRVFISSTFRDMHAERDHLVTVVFPELRECIERLGMEFFDVDLRWGIPARDVNGETANSWEYCRQWIDRVEPFFVCILGQRYGWVPEPAELKSAADRRRQQQEARSITDLEVRHATLASGPKRRSYFYLRATAAPAGDTEFVDPPPFAGKLERLKQEVRCCGRPVRDYPCVWTGSGFADLETFGRMVLEDLWSGVLRDERFVSKEIWRQLLESDPDLDPRYTDESTPVTPALSAKIVSLATPSLLSTLDAEWLQMEAFAQSRLRWFQGRKRELERLVNFIHADEEGAPRLAAVVAVPGQGKSALLAKLHQLLSATPQEDTASTGDSPLTAFPGPAGDRSLFLITHFVGATERSASAYALVDRISEELDNIGLAWAPEELEEGQEPGRDFQSLCRRLAVRLGDYTGEPKIVILLDALNQITDGHDLRWLPVRLGPGVRIVVSCPAQPTADGGPRQDPGPEQRILRELETRRSSMLRLDLGPLTENDVRSLVVDYLREYCHELDREHLDRLCAIEQAHNPLYLLVMLQELRTLGGNDLNRLVPARIATMAQDRPDIVSLFDWVLEKMEVFGSAAVGWWCLYLAYGHVGMASHELAELLERKLGKRAGSAALRIERGLRRYLQRRGPQLDFFHGQLRQAALERYGSQADAATVHREMADYFTSRAAGPDPQKEWKTESIRGFSECVFHRIKAGQFQEATRLLSSFPFLLNKLRVGLLEGVYEDYEMFRRAAPADLGPSLEAWMAFFREKAHILRRGNDEWPAYKIFLQLAIEHADDSPLTAGAQRWLCTGGCDWFWFRNISRPTSIRRDSCRIVLEGHTDRIDGMIPLAGHRLISWSSDATLRLWDDRNGTCLSVFRGHLRPVRGAIALNDDHLVSWAQDCTMRLWDIRTGTCLVVIRDIPYHVRQALLLTDGRLLSWSDDKDLKVWDLWSGNCLLVLQGHSKRVLGALLLAEERLLSWSDDRTLRIWDSRNGDCLAILQGHSLIVKGVQAASDGRIFTWSDDNALRLWDSNEGTCLAVLEGHVDTINGVMAVAENRMLSWSMDGTMRIWDSQSGSCLAVLEGHSGSVEGVRLSGDYRLLSWSADNTLRVWDYLSGACLAVLEFSLPRGALFLDEGRLISWSFEQGNIRLWDSRSGSCLASLNDSSSSWIKEVQALPDGRIVSSTGNEFLRIWDLESGIHTAPSEHRSEEIHGVRTLPNYRLASWTSDPTIRIWDSTTGNCRAILQGHTRPIEGIAPLDEHRSISWAGDKTLRIWDLRTGTCLAVLEGHSISVDGALPLAGGRVLSWSAWEESLRIWDANSGVCLALLVGHSDRIGGATVLTDGRALSWSHDGTLRVWDVQDGACSAILEDRTPAIVGIRELEDGRLLSWAADNTMRLWDLHTGLCLARFEGHSNSILGAMVFKEDRLLSWSLDNTLRLWDGRSGLCLAKLNDSSGIDFIAMTLTALPDGRVLVCSSDDRFQDSFYLLDDLGQDSLRIAPIRLEDRQHLDLAYFHLAAHQPDCVSAGFWATSRSREEAKSLTVLYHNGHSSLPAAWQNELESESHSLQPDGTLVVIRQNRQILFLKLHFGQSRVSLDEAARILGNKG